MLASATGHARLSTPETVESALHGMEDILSSTIFYIVMSVLHPVLISSSRIRSKCFCAPSMKRLYQRTIRTLSSIEGLRTMMSRHILAMFRDKNGTKCSEETRLALQVRSSL